MVQVFSVALQADALKWLAARAQEEGKPLAVLAGELLDEAIVAAREKIEAAAAADQRFQETQLELWEIDKFNSHYNEGL